MTSPRLNYTLLLKSANLRRDSRTQSGFKELKDGVLNEFGGVRRGINDLGKGTEMESRLWGLLTATPTAAIMSIVLGLVR